MTAAQGRIAAGPALVAVVATGSFVWLVWLFQVSYGVFPAASDPSLLTGAWLSDFVAKMVGMIPLPWPEETVLAVFTACIAGALLAWLYRRLVYNDWPPAEALLFVIAFGANALVVGTVAGDHRAIPVMVACAAVVPGIRRLEAVGDVQAEMSFGLVLPLLLLAGPETALLIPLLAIFGARSDPMARTDGRAFLAMFLVAILPTLIVLGGLFGLLGASGAARAFDAIYVEAYKLRPLAEEEVQSLLGVVGYGILPYLIVLVAYLFTRDRRWQPWSAVAVLGLPLYLAGGLMLFAWPMSASVPAAVFLATFASWLAVARLRPVFRLVSLALAILGAVTSWVAPVLTGEGGWLVNPPDLRGTLAP